MKKLMTLMFLCYSFIPIMAQSVITGTVTDNSGVTLPGVNVIIPGENRGTTTDFDGNYSITSSENDILQFSYIGFVTQNIPIGNQSVINVSLQEDTQKLDEVVIIGYGTATKKDLVSAVAQIKAEDIESQNISRLDQALTGTATGVAITQNNGAPGAESTIRIRGNSSISGNNSPLYVIDGFIAGNGFDLNSLGVNDVKSVEILKDATALSIYGNRGAAGVILITTKNGLGVSSGRPLITVNHFSSIDNTANQIEILGGQGYVDYINEGGQFVPGDSGFGETDKSLPLIIDDASTVPDTNWLELIEQTGFKHNTDISIAGNSDNSNYFVSLNHFKQEGIVRGSGIERYSVRTNLDFKISDNFKTGIRLSTTHFKRENNKVSYSDIVLNVLPIRAVYDQDGNFTGTNPISSSSQRNPEADIQLRVDHDYVTEIIPNLYIDWEIFENFKFRSTLGAQLTYIKENNYLPSTLPERTTGGFGRINTNFRTNVLNENTFTYNYDIGKHSLDVLGGFTWQKTNNESTRAEANGFPNDAVSFNNLSLGDPLTYYVSSGFSQRTSTSFLGRINYNYNGKYIVTLVGRYDGSSVFEAGNKWAFFPSIGAAWNIIDEDFMSNNDVFSNLKLRASYGLIGEQGVPPYSSIARYDNTITPFNETIVNGVILGSVPSSGLNWETTHQLDIGAEFGFLNGRIALEVDYYQKTTEDLLLAKSLAAQAGGGTQLVNIGSVENKGFEFALNTINVKNENFEWSSNLTISTNKSKVLELDGRDYIELKSTGNQGGNSARLIVGQPMPTFVGVKYLGTYKNSDEIIADQREGKSFIGGPRFLDLTNDGNWNNDDVQVLGSPEPDFYGGFNNVLKYKRLMLNIFFTGQYGGEIFNINAQTSFYGRGDQNIDPVVLDRWIEGVNETSNIPRAGASTSVFNPNSDVNIEDASFLRLKIITLAYDIPLKSELISSFSVYTTGQNLFLLSDYTMGDPAVNTFTSDSGFDSVSQGFGGSVYPYAKSFLLGIKLEF